MDDGAIIELYFQRDENAIHETDVKYGAFCRKVAQNILGIPEDSEECVNDVYHAVWNRIPPLIPASLRAFLGKITRDLSINRYRENRAQKRYSPLETLLSELDECVPAKSTPEAELEARLLGESISAWLDSLSVDDRALFLRRYWYGDAVKTLAKECGCTQNQMAQRMLRLRRSLRKKLEQEGVL